MKMTKILTVCALAVLLFLWAITPALAQESEAEDGEAQEGLVAIVGSLGGNSKVDVWEVKCSGLNNFVSADVHDQDALNDQYAVTVVGLSPGSLKNKAGPTRVSPVGGTSSTTGLNRPFPGAIKALVIITQIVGGSGNYLSHMGCDGKTKTPKLKQDQ